MSKIGSFLGVARAPFLLLSVTLVMSGAAAGAWQGHFDLPNTLAALVGLVALHVAVNALNEASDMRRGIDLATERTPFSGGSGVLPSGALTVRAATTVGLLGAAIGLACGIWLYSRVGPVLLPYMLVGAVLVLGYTDFLARIGVGEVVAGLGLGALPVAGTVLVQGGGVGLAGWMAAVPAFLMTFNLLLLNEFPDETADREGGRSNLVLLLGRPAAARIYALAALLVPLVILAGVILRTFPWTAVVAVLPSLFLIQPLAWVRQDPDIPVPIPALGSNVAWNLTTNLLLAGGLAAGVLLG
jgi:1,4-dihydroxy-2-naphthoate octaprenyltransferase